MACNCHTPRVGDGPTICTGCTSTVGPNTDATVRVNLHCDRHQAPHGYKYYQINGRCVMVHLATGQVVFNPGIVTSLTGRVEMGSGLANWIANNKGLALGLAVVGFLALKDSK